MKLTNQQLRQIINEELGHVMREEQGSSFDDFVRNLQEKYNDMSDNPSMSQEQRNDADEIQAILAGFLEENLEEMLTSKLNELARTNPFANDVLGDMDSNFPLE